jgi:hypothetical protein
VESRKKIHYEVKEDVCKDVRETRRLRWVIGVFPIVDSYVRLVTCYLVKY